MRVVYEIVKFLNPLKTLDHIVNVKGGHSHFENQINDCHQLINNHLGITT